MKEIKLTQGKLAIVDDEDYEELNSHKWCCHHGYAVRSLKVSGKCITSFMHRAILDAPKGLQVDHIDGNPLNNQKSNLRIVTTQQNQFNRRAKKKSTSRVKGVCYKKRDRAWVACSRYYGKAIHLGSFTNEVDAAMAYNRFAAEHHGEYARLNQIF